MTSSFRRAIAAASVTLALVGGLAACATESDATAEQAQAYRAQVVTIAEYSAAGQYANARAALDALQAEIDAAVAAGTVTGEREARIVEAIALVRADLDAAIAAATATVPEPEPAPPAGDDADDDENRGPGGDDEDEPKPKPKDDKPDKGKDKPGKDKGKKGKGEG